MSMRYAHTNIIAKDWRKLAKFYQEVFGCNPMGPERELSGKWLEQGTAIKDAALIGIHLQLPGHGANAPSLEIFQYKENLSKTEPITANREGYGHIAFEVDDINEIINKALEHGASKVGELVQKEINNVGILSFIYITDPEGNIIELQNWSN